jgi:serine/threonine protein kinase/tetratricopeptide (TPR) repeat protein
MICPTCHSENPEDSRYCNKCATRLTPFGKDDSAHVMEDHIPIKEYEPGSVISGKYKLIKKIGGGGMGSVYSAEDIRLKRPIALKFLHPDLTHNTEAKSRFIQEAQAASALEHNNICTIHEVDETSDGLIYIAMTFYQGETIKERIGKGTFEIGEAIDVMTQLGEGLENAHKQGIVHRDIKPANIMITSDGTVKILDFGIAKLSAQTDVTRTASIVGTAAYMSPEQAKLEEVDERTDIWAAGALLYEMLTGKIPFKGDSIQTTIYSLLSKSPLPMTDIRKDIPEEIEALVFRCLRKKKEERFPSAQHLVKALKAFEDTQKREEREDPFVEAESIKTKRETERRQATVMFVEISGYTEILESLGVEETSLVLNRCFDLFDSLRKKYGGWTDKLTSNSFVAYFGVPKATENAPIKAINAAIEFKNSLNQLSLEQNLSIQLGFRMGISTGTVIAGEIGIGGKKEYSVVGNTVNLASHLKDLAEPGQIFVDSMAHRYTKDKFEYSRLKPITIGGTSKPVTVFELQSERDHIYRDPFISERTIHAKLVGREPEMDKLELHVLKVINNEGSIINVIGEAGIGKSRLISELINKDYMKKVTFLRGRALSVGTNLSYHPLIDLLKNWAMINEDDSASVSSQKLQRAISLVFPEGEDEIFPFLATLMGIKLSGKHAERIEGIEGEALEKLILKNLRELVIKASEQRPVIVFIDDLHWADLTSIDFLESLYRLAESHSILFINAFRPRHKATGDRIQRKIQARHSEIYHEITLDPLNNVQCGALIDSMMNTKDFSSAISDLITKKTEGNPFFIEEVMRSFIDDGIIEIKNGKFRVTQKIDSVVIPETIHDILMTRIDRLDNGTRSLLKVASVIGRSFFYKILAQVAESVDKLDERLDFLKEIELVKERQRLAEVEYLFKHALVQEVTYESILERTKKELHLKIADAIEKIFSERLNEFYGFLALHYSKGEDNKKAEEYLIKAGREALKAAASTEALNYYQQALELFLRKHGESGEPAMLAELEKNIGIALYNKSHMEEAVAHFDRVLHYWGEKKPKRRISILLNLIASLVSILKELYVPGMRTKRIPDSQAIEFVDISFKRGTALTSVDSFRMFVYSLWLLRKLNKLNITQVPNGVSIYIQGCALFSFAGVLLKVAKKILDYPITHMTELELKDRIGYSFSQLLHGVVSGNWDQEHGYDEQAVEAALKFGQLWNITTYFLWCGLLQSERGLFAEWEKSVNKLEDIGNLYEYDFAHARASLIKMRHLVKQRKIKEAQQEMDDAMRGHLTAIGHSHILFILGLKAYAQAIERDIKAAEKSLTEAKEFIAQEKRTTPYHMSNFAIGQFLYDICVLEASLNSGAKEQSALYRKRASQSGKEAVRNARKFAPNKTEVYRLLGVYYWLISKQKKAISCWRKSIKIGEELGAKVELARTFAEIGRRLIEEKSRYQELDSASPQFYFEKARALFEGLNLKWDLDEMNALKR